MFNDEYTEYKSKGYENTSTKKYLEKIRPNLGNMIDDIRASGKWKIHLTMEINFMLSKDSSESQ